MNPYLAQSCPPRRSLEYTSSPSSPGLVVGACDPDTCSLCKRSPGAPASPDKPGQGSGRWEKAQKEPQAEWPLQGRNRVCSANGGGLGRPSDSGPATASHGQPRPSWDYSLLLGCPGHCQILGLLIKERSRVASRARMTAGAIDPIFYC